ncbi:MAG: sulfatase-like hydrolase/transferase, partial [Sphaerochaeta sp.]
MKPNIVIVMTDQQRHDLRKAAGYPLDTMPFLDSFAEKGVDFSQAYTPNPTCMPARVSMFTGRYCHTDGIRSIQRDNHLPQGTPNLLSFLKDKGYETAYFGHNHVFKNLLTGQNKKGESESDYHSFSDGPLAE